MSGNNQVSVQEVHKLITDWASSNEHIRRPAEERIEKLLIISNGQIDNFIIVLCELLSHPEQTSSDIRIRIAILIRKRIAAKLDNKYKKPIFCQLNLNTRHQILVILLKQLYCDPDANTRNQIADCIIELSTRTFNELSNEYTNVSFIKKIFELYNLSDTNNNNNNNNNLDIINRINALSIFGHLCEYCSFNNIIKQHQSSIAQIYKVAFKQDTNRKVNIAALEAIQLTMKPLQNEQIFGFKPLMFDVLKLLENTLNIESKNNDYEQTQYILEIINQIVCDKPLIFNDNNSINNLNIKSPLISYCNAFTQLAITKHLPNKIRELSLEFFLSLSENAPSLVRKKEIICKTILNICIDHFLLEQITDNEWNELNYGEDETLDSNLCNYGEYAIDRLIESLTSEYVLPIIYSKCINNNKYFNNSNWRYRHCILTIITQISDYIKHKSHKSNELIICVDKCIELLINDNNYRIKYACINTIGQLCHDHYDIIPNKYSDIIIKNLLIILNNNNNNIKIKIHSCAALINLIPTLETKHILEPKLSNLLNCIMNILKNTNNIKLKEQALTAIAAIATISGDLFNKYYDLFSPLLMNIIKNSSSIELQDIRCRAIECMGCFGEAVGGNKFKQNAIELMNGTILFFKNKNINEIADDPFIKTNITLWSRILQSIGTDEFYKYLPTLCKILNDIININIINNDYHSNQNDDNIYDICIINDQKLENKLSALYTIDSFLDKYNNKMILFIDKLFNSLLECIKCKYSLELRIESIQLSIRYIDTIINCNKIESKQLLMCDKLLNIFINILNENECESACIGTVCKILLEFINKIVSIDISILKIFINLEKLEYIIDCMFLCVIRSQNRIEIFSKQELNNNYDAIAKLEFKEEKEFEDDLLFNIALILAEFIKIYKDNFIKILIKNNNISKLINFLNPSNIISKDIINPQFIHKTGVYIICDIYEQCNPINTCKLLNNFIPQIIQIINNDNDLAVQQACFYCLGLMVNKCKNNTINYIQKILTLCIQCINKNSKQYINSSICIINDNYNQQLFEKRKFLGVIDNAMATICKILKDIQWNNIQSNNNSNINNIRNQSLSIWLKHLPLKSDCVEAQICHNYLFKLLQNKNQIIIGKNLSNLPFIFKIFAVIKNTQLSTNDLDVVIGEFVKTICNSQPQFAQNLSIQDKTNLGLI